MNVYVDSSAVLRLIFGEDQSLLTWPDITSAVTSELLRVECLRTIDRERVRGTFDDEIGAVLRTKFFDTISSFETIALDHDILERSAEPFPTTLGTLDAIHLSSALAARKTYADITVATHDRELAIGARAMGFEVLG